MALPADTLSTPDQQRQQCVLPAHQQPPQPQLQPQQPAACTKAMRPHRVRRCSFPPVSSAGAAATPATTTPRIPQPPARALSPIASAPALATLPLADLISPPPKPVRQQQQEHDTGSARAWRRRRSLYASGSCKSSPELCSWRHRAGPDQGATALPPQQAQHSPGRGEPASGSDGGSGCEADLSHLLALQAAAVEAAALQLLSPAADTNNNQLGVALAQEDRSRSQLQQALQEARAAQHGLQGQCAMLHDAVCQLQQEKERLQQQLADLESKFTLRSDSGSHRESSRAARGDGSAAVAAAAAPAAAAAAAAAAADPGLQQQQQPHLACLLAQLREAQAEVDALVAAELASQKEALLLQQQRRQLQQHPGAAGAAAVAVAASPGAVDRAAALQAQLARAHQHKQDLNAELLQLPAAGEGMALLCKIQSIKQQLQACRQQIAEHRSLGQQLAAAAAAAAAVPAAGCGSSTPPPARVLLLQQDSHGSLLSVLGCAGPPLLNGGGTVVAAREECLGLSSPLAAAELQRQLGDEPQTRRVRFASKLPLLLVSPAAPPAPGQELPAAGSSTADLSAASQQQPASARRRPAPPPKVAAVQPQSARQRLLKHSHQHNPLAPAAAAAAAGPEAPVALAASGSSGHTASGPTPSKAAGSNGGISTSGSGGAPCVLGCSLQLPGQDLGSSFKPWSLHQQQQQQPVPGQYAVALRPRSCRFRNEGPGPALLDPAAISGPAFSGGSASACRQLSPLLLPGRSQGASGGSGAGAGRLRLPYEQMLVSPVRSASTGIATSSGTAPFTPGSSTPGASAWMEALAWAWPGGMAGLASTGEAAAVSAGWCRRRRRRVSSRVVALAAA